MCCVARRVSRPVYLQSQPGRRGATIKQEVNWDLENYGMGNSINIQNTRDLDRADATNERGAKGCILICYPLCLREHHEQINLISRLR